MLSRQRRRALEIVGPRNRELDKLPAGQQVMLKLTLPEAMAVFLSARLVGRFMDRNDPHLASAFTKLERAVGNRALAAAIGRDIHDPYELYRRQQDQSRGQRR